MTGRRPDPNEVVRPRKTHPLMPNGTWKVTARYMLFLTATTRIGCVRVRGPYLPTGNALVLHLSEKEFTRLFMPVKKRA